MVLSLLVSLRFQVLFHSPPGVLFTFPSRYYSLSVTWSYLAFWDGPHFFRQDFSCPDVLRIPLRSLKISSTGLSPSLIHLSKSFDYSSRYYSSSPYPETITASDLSSPISLATTFGINVFFFSWSYLDVSVHSVSLLIHYVFMYGYQMLYHLMGSPIQISMDLWIFAPPRSFSQLVTSFFGATYQGILRNPFVA